MLARRIAFATTDVIHRRGSNVRITTSRRFDAPVTTDDFLRSKARNDSRTTSAEVCIRAR